MYSYAQDCATFNVDDLDDWSSDESDDESDDDSEKICDTIKQKCLYIFKSLKLSCNIDFLIVISFILMRNM